MRFAAHRNMDAPNSRRELFPFCEQFYVFKPLDFHIASIK